MLWSTRDLQSPEGMRQTCAPQSTAGRVYAPAVPRAAIHEQVQQQVMGSARWAGQVWPAEGAGPPLGHGQRLTPEAFSSLARKTGHLNQSAQPLPVGATPGPPGLSVVFA